MAQGAREILDSGNWGYPTIGGLPWLEKPPLPWWLVAALGHCAGGVNETMARLPSALAAIVLVLGVAILATRHYGPYIGLLAGAVQATTAWTVIRGRLAEADILLACLITWAIVAFDRFLADAGSRSAGHPGDSAQHWCAWRWVFLVSRDYVSCQGNWFWRGADSIRCGRRIALAARLRFASSVTGPGRVGLGGAPLPCHGRYLW